MIGWNRDCMKSRNSVRKVKRKFRNVASRGLVARREDDEEEPDGKDEEGRRMITLRTVYGYDTLEHANAITIIKAPARYIHGDVTNPTKEK